MSKAATGDFFLRSLRTSRPNLVLVALSSPMFVSSATLLYCNLRSAYGDKKLFCIYCNTQVAVRIANSTGKKESLL